MKSEIELKEYARRRGSAQLQAEMFGNQPYKVDGQLDPQKISVVPPL